MESNLCWPFITVMAIYSCDGHLLLPWSVADIPSEKPLKKTDVPLSSSYQLQISSWQELDYVPTFSSSCWNVCLSVWHFSCPVHALTVSVSSYAHLPCCVWKCYLKITHTSGFYNLLVCPHTPDLWREGCDKDTPSRDEHSKVFHSLYVVQLWVLYISSFAPKVVNGTSDLNIVIQFNLHASLWNSLSRIPWKTIKWWKRFPSRISSVLTFTRIHDYEEPLKQYFYN